MDDLARWLGEQFDEDERIARAATQGPWLVDCETHAEAIIAGDGTSVIAGGRWGDEASAFESTEDALHIAAHDPARVLWEIEAKRSLVAAYADALTVGPDIEGGYKRPIREALARQARNFLIVLALPFADRPGFAEAIASAE